MEDVVVVPNAQSDPNEVGICVSGVGAGSLETPMTQKIPCKWCSYTFHFVIIPSFDSVVSIVSIYIVLL